MLSLGFDPVIYLSFSFFASMLLQARPLRYAAGKPARAAVLFKALSSSTTQYNYYFYIFHVYFYFDPSHIHTQTHTRRTASSVQNSKLHLSSSLLLSRSSPVIAMATVECCEFLSTSTKAKLQDAGLLYLADLTRLMRNGDAQTADARNTQILGTLQRRLAQRQSSIQQAGEESSAAPSMKDAAAATNGVRESLMPTPIDNLSFFTDDEINEVYEALSRYTRYTANDPACTSAAATASGCEGASRSGASGIPGCQSLRQIHTEVTARRAAGVPLHATTFSRELDALLGGGGVPVGGVTEISGPPGVGKTQLMLQLAVSCVMPIEFGGLGGTCIFVDTEGSFVAERLEQMATAAVSLVNTILAKNAAQQRMRGGCTKKNAKRSSSNGDAVSESVGAALRKRSREDISTYPSNEWRSEEVPCLPSEKTADGTHQLRGASENLIENDIEEASGSVNSETAFTVESVLQRVRYVRVTELTDLLALVYGLPLWLGSQRSTQSEGSPHAAAADPKPTPLSAGQREGAGHSQHDEQPPVRMLLIDSIALPFRSSDAFEKNAAVYDDMYGSPPPPSSFSGPSGTRTSTHGSLSKQGLWQRSRLLYQCSTALDELAASFHIAVVVTNHMTTKLLKSPSVNGQAPHAMPSAETDANGGHSGGGRQVVLLPALGDAWGHGLSTRLLLAFHHYELPSCAFTAAAAARDTEPSNAEGNCLEDVVHTTTATSSAMSGVTRVVQHRVARLLKASGQPRRETCFLITTKGVRDVRKDMVQTWVAAQISAKE